MHTKTRLVIKITLYNLDNHFFRF